MAVCDKFKNSIRHAMRLFDEFMEKHVGLALKITTAIRDGISGAPGAILDAVIPGDQSGLRKKLADILSEGIDLLNIVDTCKKFTDPEEKLHCFAIEILKLEPLHREGMLHKLASFVSSKLDGRYPGHIYDLFTQVEYSGAKPLVAPVKFNEAA